MGKLKIWVWVHLYRLTIRDSKDKDILSHQWTFLGTHTVSVGSQLAPTLAIFCMHHFENIA